MKIVRSSKDDNRNSPESAVPPDFPRPQPHSAVSGAQAKLLLSSYEGKFYAPGNTPPEVSERWNVCEDLARQLAQKALESKSGKRAHMHEVAILDQYLPRLIATKWTSAPEAIWIIRRCAEILGWPAPDSVKFLPLDEISVGENDDK